MDCNGIFLKKELFSLSVILVNVKTFVATLKVLAQDIVAVVFFFPPCKKSQSKKHQGIDLSLVFLMILYHLCC